MLRSLVLLLLLALPAQAGTRDDLVHELDALRAEATTASASEQELARVLALVREARAILTGSTGLRCRDVVFPVYREIWTGHTALSKTMELCGQDLEPRGQDLAWFLDKTSKIWTGTTAVDKAVAYTRATRPGSLDAVVYAWGVTTEIWTGTTAVDKAIAYATSIPPGQLDCVKFAHESTRQTWTGITALERAIDTCR